jgi:aryl-alcohol dehydrogenase-like predicted oxidoreductase
MEYSLWTRDAEAEILPVLQELGIGLVPYSPLGRGFLTGAFRKRDDLLPTDRRHAHPRFQEGNFEANLALLEPIAAVAQAHGVTRGQVTLAWLLAQWDGLVPIPGTKRRTFLEENLAALDLTLSPADIASLSDALPTGSAQGLRYPEFQLRKLGI